MNEAKVAVVMGSSSDWEQMKEACEILDELEIKYILQVVSAHRMPFDMLNFASEARDKGLEIIIAGAGGAAHLPGMLASSTTLPVIGVPIKTSTLSGQDSLLSIVQMPGGIPVGTMAIGSTGAKNAGLYAARILALHDEELHKRYEDFKRKQYDHAVSMTGELTDEKN